MMSLLRKWPKFDSGNLGPEVSVPSALKDITREENVIGHKNGEFTTFEFPGVTTAHKYDALAFIFHDKVGKGNVRIHRSGGVPFVVMPNDVLEQHFTNG